MYSVEAVRTRARLTVPSPSGKVSSTMAFGGAAHSTAPSFASVAKTMQLD